MGRPAARVTDGVKHLDADGNIINDGSNGSLNVFIGGLRAARIGDKVKHGDDTCVITKGSSSVFINGRPAARMGDAVSCGGVIIGGYGSVRIGGGSTGLSAPSNPSSSSSASGSQTGHSSETSTGVKTGLGAEVDKLAAKSPTLQKDIKDIQDKNWEITYGIAGKGSYANRDVYPPVIVIDEKFKNNPDLAVLILSHEVGHAEYSFQADYSSKEVYVNTCLADEGAAVMEEIKVEREINSGGRIRITALGDNAVKYNQIYDDYLGSGDAAVARNKIGAIFRDDEITSTTHEPYGVYYGKGYDDWQSQQGK
jgi:type VI secretion system secreted protein VgrG